MWCKAGGDRRIAVADNQRRIYGIVLILATIAVAAPVLAQNAGVDPVSAFHDRDFRQSSEGTPTAPTASQPSESPPIKSTAWWSRICDHHWALGAGTTFQYDGSQGTNLGVITWTSREDRYELAVFRFLKAQMRHGDPLAEPNWIFEASRRWRLHWRLIDHSGLDLFFGFGAAYKTEIDDLNGSTWNFAEQFGWRFPKQANGGRVEFAIRHVSNAGIKKPNRGEDFLTLAYLF